MKSTLLLPNIILNVVLTAHCSDYSNHSHYHTHIDSLNTVLIVCIF